MPNYRHGDTGYAGVNAAMGANFARNGGIMGMFKDPQKEAQLRAIAAEMALQKMRGEQGMALGAQSNATAMALQKLMGGQKLSEEEQKHVHKLLEDSNQGDQARKTNRDTQSGAVMGAAGVMQKEPETANEKLFSGITADRATRNQGNKLDLENADVGVASKIKASPEYADASMSGTLATKQRPAYENQQLGAVQAAPGATVFTPSSGSAAPPSKPGDFNQIQGSARNTSITPGTLDPMTGMMRPDKIISTETPGSMLPKIPVLTAPPRTSGTGTMPPPMGAGPIGMPPTGVQGMPPANPGAAMGALDPQMIMQLLQAIKAKASYQGNPISGSPF